MFGLPMEIIGPVIGIGSLIMFVSGGIVMVRYFTSKIASPDEKSRLADAEIQLRLGELDQLTQRLSELEERVDFAERLLANQREAPRLGPSQE